MQTKSFNGFVYFATFIDDYSRFTIVYFLKRNFNVILILLFYKTFVEIQIANKMKCLRSNNGCEYTSSHFIKIYEDHGNTRQYIMPQNGKSKWKTHTLVEVIHNMLTTTKLPHILG